MSQRNDTAPGGRSYRRYVAIGDSTSEGLDDPDGRGGYRGWADRFAGHVARAQGGGLEYANLAVRGKLTAEIYAEQLPHAVALEPDLATVVCGMNDVLRRRFDPAVLADQVYAMQQALISRGATVLTFTMPDPGPVMPLARPMRPRFLALNAALREASDRSGAILLDLGAHPVASDPRLWSDDRLHANADGHARIGAALAYAVGLSGFDASWTEPLPGGVPRSRLGAVRAEAIWIRRHLVPWIGRHLRGRSSGDGVTAKRPKPTAVECEA